MPHKAAAAGLVVIVATLAVASSVALPDLLVSPALLALGLAGVAAGAAVGRSFDASTADRVRLGRRVGAASGLLLAGVLVGSAAGVLPRTPHSTLWELQFLLASNPPPSWVPIPSRLADEASLLAAGVLAVLVYTVEAAVAAGATGPARPAASGDQ